MPNPITITVIPSPQGIPPPAPPAMAAIAEPIPLIPGMVPIGAREIRESCWAAARDTLLANPNLEYAQTYDGHQQNTWTYFIYRTPNGLIRRIYRNNQLVRSYPDRVL